MAESEFRKIQLEQRKLDRKLDKIAEKRTKEFDLQRKLSNAPPQVRIMLSKRSHPNLNDENLNRTHRRIKIR